MEVNMCLNILPGNKSRVEELSEFIYPILEEWKNHDLTFHQDRQDVAWDIAVKIYEKYKK